MKKVEDEGTSPKPHTNSHCTNKVYQSKEAGKSAAEIFGFNTSTPLEQHKSANSDTHTMYVKKTQLQHASEEMKGTWFSFILSSNGVLHQHLGFELLRSHV
jgi:hypothetical protein